MKIGPHPGMRRLKQFAHRSDGDDLAVRQCRDAVADGIQAGEIVRDHEHRQSQCFLQCLDQHIEIARPAIGSSPRSARRETRSRDRVRARGPTPRAWSCLRTIRKETLSPSFRLQPDRHFELGGGDLVHQRVRQHQIFAKGKLDDFAAPLMTKTTRPAGTECPIVPRHSALTRSRLSPIAVPITSISPPCRGMRPMMVRIRTDLPPPEAPDQAEDLASAHVQRQVVDHDMPAKTDH